MTALIHNVLFSKGKRRTSANQENKYKWILFRRETRGAYLVAVSLSKGFKVSLERLFDA
jgi:hypothetical protein